MRLTESQIERLSQALLKALAEQAGAQLKAQPGKVQERIAAIVRENLQQEQALEADARRLLDAQMKNAPAGIDQHRLLQMIKKKLAEDRGFPL